MFQQCQLLRQGRYNALNITEGANDKTGLRPILNDIRIKIFDQISNERVTFYVLKFTLLLIYVVQQYLKNNMNYYK